MSTTIPPPGTPRTSRNLHEHASGCVACAEADATLKALADAGEACNEVFAREPEDTEEYADAVASARDLLVTALRLAGRIP